MILQAISSVASRFGFEIRPDGFRSDFDDASAAIIRRVANYTMTTPERIYSMVQAVRYILAAEVVGDIVECGVWRGGSMMAAALTLLDAGRDDIDLYLFDTFEGMPPPTEDDVDFRGTLASKRMAMETRSKRSHLWAYAPLDDVRRNLESTGYPRDRVHLIRGRVEKTLPEQAPERLSLLRLDTDWYESTRHELIHLYPRLSSRGVLILDDYGHWKGSKRAFDEFAQANDVRILLNRIDYASRTAVKP